MESTWNIIAIIGRLLCFLVSVHVLFSMKSLSLSLSSLRGGGLTNKEFKLAKIFNGSSVSKAPSCFPPYCQERLSQTASFVFQLLEALSELTDGQRPTDGILLGMCHVHVDHVHKLTVSCSQAHGFSTTLM